MEKQPVNSLVLVSTKKKKTNVKQRMGTGVRALGGPPATTPPHPGHRGSQDRQGGSTGNEQPARILI